MFINLSHRNERPCGEIIIITIIITIIKRGKIHMHTTILQVTPPMNRVSKMLEWGKQLPAKWVLVLPILSHLCQHPRAREARQATATVAASWLPVHGSESREPPQQTPSLSWLCSLSPASSRSSLSRPRSSSHPSIYTETFNFVFTAEEFEQLTIAISEITFVVSSGQNKPYLPNWFTVFNFFWRKKAKLCQQRIAQCWNC